MLQRLSIKSAVIIALILGLFLPSVTAFHFIQMKNEQKLKDKLIAKNKEMLKTVRLSISNYIVSFNYDVAKSFLLPVFQSPDIINIEIFDHHTRQSFVRIKKENYLSSLPCLENSLVRLNEDVIHQGVKISEITVTFSMCDIDKSIIDARKDFYQILMLQFIISFISIFCVIQYKLLSPLKRLGKQFKKLRRNGLDKSFKWREYDEIDHIGQSLEKTRLSLFQLFDKERKDKESIDQLNKQLDEYNHQLEEKVQRNVAEIMKKDRLIQKDIVNMIAHQWRQPLNILALNILNIESRLAFSEDEIEMMTLLDRQELRSLIKGKLSICNREIQLLSQTIDDFRNFYEPNQRAEEVDLSYPIDQAIKVVKPLFDEECISIKTHYNTTVKVKIFVYEIMRTLLNILKNAQENFKTSHALVSKQIDITTFQTDQYSTIEIVDNGGGIDLTIQEQMFDPYFSTKEEKHGVGLGLYMAKLIVEDHHKGHLFYKKHEDCSVFVIELPLKK